MKNEKYSPVPPDLETWLSGRADAEREALRNTWLLFNQTCHFSMQTKEIDRRWESIAHATAPRLLHLSRLRAAAAAALLLSAGWAIGKWSVPAATTGPGKTQYALLVKADDIPPADGMQQFIEYSAWVDNLKKERWAGGEALQEEVWRLNRTATGDISVESGTLEKSPREVSGFFLFEAADTTEALRIARTCPHLRYNGTLELRKIYP
jgi:hypothetical protein